MLEQSTEFNNQQNFIYAYKYLSSSLKSLIFIRLLAAKIHYFGVGGGIADFETLVNTDRTFEIVSVYRITEGM